MTEPVNVLITAASRRVALVRSFQDSLKKLGLEGNVYASDIDPLSAALNFCKKKFIVPLSTSPNYINIIKRLCAEESISVIIPTIDEELPVFGRCKDEFLKLGVRVVVSSEETGNICNDKFMTSKFLRKFDHPIAETWLPEEVRQVKPDFPLFIKPRFGRGAVGAHMVRNQRELDFFLDFVNKPVVQPYLPGDEYTVDLLADFDGNIISVVPRQRLVIRSGVCDRGRTKKHAKLIDTSIEMARSLKIVGPANMQCKMQNDEPMFFEVNPRFSGAIQLTIASGADFPSMILRMLDGSVPSAIGDFQEGLTMVSYEESIYHIEENR